MPRLNQNQRVQALTMLACGDNVSNVSRAFGCHRNTIIRLREHFQQTGGVADRTEGSLRRTFDVVFKRRQVLQGSTVSANRQCYATSGKPGNQFGQGGPMWDKCLQHVIGLPIYTGHNGISVGGDSSGLGFYSLMSLGLTLVIMTVEFEFFRRRGERFADDGLIESDRFGGGGVMVWDGIMGRRKTNLIVVQGNLNAQGYINQIMQPEAVPFLQRHGPAILMHCNTRPHVARICRQFLNRNNVNVLPWPAVSPDMNPIEHICDYLGRKIRSKGSGKRLNSRME